MTKEELIQFLSDNGYDTDDETISLVIKKSQEEMEHMATIHRLLREQNRAASVSKKERKHRTHQLCNIGGAVASFRPELTELNPHELYDLFLRIFSVKEVKALVNNAISNRDILKEGQAPDG